MLSISKEQLFPASFDISVLATESKVGWRQSSLINKTWMEYCDTNCSILGQKLKYHWNTFFLQGSPLNLAPFPGLRVSSGPSYILAGKLAKLAWCLVLGCCKATKRSQDRPFPSRPSDETTILACCCRFCKFCTRPKKTLTDDMPFPPFSNSFCLENHENVMCALLGLKRRASVQGSKKWGHILFLCCYREALLRKSAWHNSIESESIFSSPSWEAFIWLKAVHWRRRRKRDDSVAFSMFGLRGFLLMCHSELGPGKTRKKLLHSSSPLPRLQGWKELKFLLTLGHTVHGFEAAPF